MIRTGTAATGWELVVEIPGRVLDWAAPERLCFPAVIEAADLQPGTRLLDIGCGSGRLLEMAAFAEPGSLLTGVDSDPDALELARKLTRSSPAPIDIRRAQAEALPFASGYFDVVTCTLMLSTLAAEARDAALAECARVLRPGGLVAVADWRPIDCLPVGLARGLARRLGVWRFVSPLGDETDTGGPLDWLSAAGFGNARKEHGYCAVIGRIEVATAHVPEITPENDVPRSGRPALHPTYLRPQSRK